MTNIFEPITIIIKTLQHLTLSISILIKKIVRTTNPKLKEYIIRSHKWLVLLMHIFMIIIINIYLNNVPLYCDDRTLYDQMNDPNIVLGSDGMYRRYHPDGSTDITHPRGSLCGIKFYETPEGLLINNDGYNDHLTGYRALQDNYCDSDNDSSYSSDLDNSTNAYVTEGPLPIPEIPLPNPQKLFEDFLLVVNTAQNRPDYYAQYFDYISRRMPESIWSTSAEELESADNALATYLDSFVKNIYCNDSNTAFDIYQL